jgi:hypothetical protein
MSRRVALGVLGSVIVVVVAVVTVLVSGPGAGTPAERSLASWQQFPATAVPRPIVPMGSVNAPDAGFPTGDAKVAFIEGRFILRTALPTGPRSKNGYQLISAASALGLMRGRSGKGPSTPSLPITRVVLADAWFPTDRRDLLLPAWKFYFRGIKQPAAVLALTGARVFEAPPTHDYAHGIPITAEFGIDPATVSHDGRDVTVSFVGGHAGRQPCDVSYTATAATSSHAVALTIIEHPVPVPAGLACDLVGYNRRATVDLHQPLGGRVLIDGTDGALIAVTTNQQ